jgi:hypothetical protein
MRNVHHRRPKSRQGETSRFNCVKVDSKRHNLWHCLWGNMTGDEIMADWNRNWLDPRFKIVPR